LPASCIAQGIGILVCYPEIKNFAKAGESFYRSSQSDREDFKAMVRLRVRTVFNFRKSFFYSKGSFKEQRELVNSLGMRYINLPMIPLNAPIAE